MSANAAPTRGSRGERGLLRPPLIKETQNLSTSLLFPMLTLYSEYLKYVDKKYTYTNRRNQSFVAGFDFINY